MYPHYSNFPRLDDTVPMLARLHVQELHRQAAQERLARSVVRERGAATALLPMLVRSILHAPWIRITKQLDETRMGLPAGQIAPETWIPCPDEAPLGGRRATE